MPASFLPKSVTALRGYTSRQFLADLQAGIIVGIVAIPLALASGVAPEKGLVTAVVAGFAIALLRRADPDAPAGERGRSTYWCGNCQR